MGLERVLDAERGAEGRTNPTRDLVHIWPYIVEKVRDGLARDMWEPWFKDYLALYPITEEQLLLAAACMERALYLCGDPQLNHPGKTIVVSGFVATPPPAQLIVLSKMAQLTYGAFWSGFRSANPEGCVPDSLARLGRSSSEMMKALRKRWSSPGGWPQGVSL
jgi:hypothetical protein